VIDCILPTTTDSSYYMSDEEEDMDAVLVRLESSNSPIRRIDSRNRLYQDKENEDT